MSVCYAGAFILAFSRDTVSRGAHVSSNFEYKDSYSYGVAVVLVLIGWAVDVLAVRCGLAIAAAPLLLWPTLHRRYKMSFAVTLMSVSAVAFLVGLGVYGLQRLGLAGGDETVKETTQPDIEVLAPELGYLLRWDPPAKMYIQSVPWEGGNLPPEGTAVPSPRFRIKNLGAAVARNLQLKWKLLLDEKEFLNAIAKPELFRKYNARFDEQSGRFYIGGGKTDTNEWNALLAGDYTWSMPFLAPEMNNTSYVDSPIPYGIYQLVEIYSCALISNDPLSRELISVPLTLTISWDKPTGGKPVSFSVRAIIQSMAYGPGSKIKDASDEWVQPPKVMGTIGFQVELLSPLSAIPSSLSEARTGKRE